MGVLSSPTRVPSTRSPPRICSIPEVRVIMVATIRRSIVLKNTFQLSISVCLSSLQRIMAWVAS